MAPAALPKRGQTCALVPLAFRQARHNCATDVVHTPSHGKALIVVREGRLHLVHMELNDGADALANAAALVRESSWSRVQGS